MSGVDFDQNAPIEVVVSHGRKGTFDNVPKWQGNDAMNEFMGYSANQTDQHNQQLQLNQNFNYNSNKLGQDNYLHKKQESWFTEFKGYNAQDIEFIAKIAELTKIINEKDNIINSLTNENVDLKNKIKKLNKKPEKAQTVGCLLYTLY